MSDRAISAAKQLDAVLEALQKSLLETSDEDVAKELRSAAMDPLKAMEVMNFADERAVDEYFRRVREGLAQERAESMRRINGVGRQLPASRTERLDLLTSICLKHVDTMTAQFRDLTSFDNLDDAELSSMLQHLAALGYLPTDDSNGG
jgi:hypothetical protein